LEVIHLKDKKVKKITGSRNGFLETINKNIEEICQSKLCNHAIYVLIKQDSELCKTKQLILYGHVQRMANNRWPNTSS
jgi:hypothetical protein